VVLSDDLEGPKDLCGDQLESLRVAHRLEGHKHGSGLDGAVALGDAVALQRLATPQQLRACRIDATERSGAAREVKGSKLTAVVKAASIAVGSQVLLVRLMA
jgi:hypothetical protein